MDQGIGRTGYRLLALVFLALSALGLGMTWFAFVEPSAVFLAVGIGLAGSSAAFLFTMALAMSGPSPDEPAGRRSAPAAGKARKDARAAKRRRAAEGRPEAEARSRAAPDREPDASASGGFEFEDAELAAAPEKMVLPDAFQEDARRMPDPDAPVVEFKQGDGGPPAGSSASAKGSAVKASKPTGAKTAKAPARPSGSGSPDGWPARRKPVPQPGKAAEAPTPTRHRELADRYTQTTPMLRQIMEDEVGGSVDGPDARADGAGGQAQAIREVEAEKDSGEFDPDWSPGDRARGRCGECDTVILAPKQRPIKLRCPVCSKVTLLE